MEAHNVTRRLAAIFAADIAGYSRLMEADEAGTLARLKAHRAEIIDPKIAQHHGRIVKTTGDGVLVEFGSVVNAVQCAVEVQREMAQQNTGVPEDKRIEFRIGINLGDVIIDGDDLYGEGVNVAARLEGLAEAGGICISDDAYRQVEGKIDLGYEDLGEQKFKNIEKPVRVYRVRLEPGAAGTVTAVKRTGQRRWRWVAVAAVAVVVIGGAAIWNFYLRPRAPRIEPVSLKKLAFPLPDKPSIAVLPFTNMSDDPKQEYFSDGITEDIITDLSKISGLFVIARNSTFTYKGKLVKVQQVGRELGVRYVLEGSVRKAGGRVRVTAQLVDAKTGSHLWAERYDRDLKNIFDVQDEITKQIVAALDVKLKGEEAARDLRRMTSNAEAYDYLLRGRRFLHHITKEGNTLARTMFDKAVKLDPRWAAAWTFLAWTHAQDVRFRWSEDARESLQEAEDLARTALALDDSFAGTFSLLGDLHLIKREHGRAISLGRKAVALAPNASASKALLAMALMFSGRPEEAVPLMKEAMRLDPHYPAWFLWCLGNSYRLMGRQEEAIGVFKEQLTRQPGNIFPHLNLAQTYSQAGQLEKARAHAAEIRKIAPGFSLKRFGQGLFYKDPIELKRGIDALRKAGLPE